MGYNKKFADHETCTQVIGPIATSSGSIAGSKVDARAAGRARFIFSFGTPSSGASVNSLHIWNGPTTSSGGTYTMITGASTGVITTGVGSNANVIIDVAVDPNYGWLQMSGALTNSLWPVSCVCILSGIRGKPPTSLSGVIVSV